ncbi:MAG: ABC transporter permease [Rhodospirillaceae bacterium]
MNMLHQIFAVTAMNLSALRARAASSLVVVIGMAVVVAVTAAIMSLAVGASHSQDAFTRPGEVYIFSENTRFEGPSSISRDKVIKILDAPGIRKGTDGKPDAIADATLTLPLRMKANGRERPFWLRGTAERFFTYRPDHRIIEGRAFKPGLRELVVGKSASEAFEGLTLGGEVRLADGPWTVVGIYATDGGASEWYGYAEADTFMSAIRRANFNSVSARVDGEEGLKQLREALDADPTLDVRAWTAAEYWSYVLASQVAIYQGIAYGVGIIMGLGTLAAALSIMYAAVGARGVEIATLRAIGFGPGPVAVSVMFEALLLAGTGALLGAGVAFSIFNNRLFYSPGWGAFHMKMDLEVAALAALITILVGGIAGLFPAIRAARAPIVMALQQR